MARFLALDGDSNRVQVLSANVKGESVRLENALDWEESQPVTSANAAAVGARLREQLQAAGVAAAPLLVCVGRERVILKEIRIPAVAEHEEPAVVHFQAMKEFTDGGDEIVLDYTPVGPAGPEGRRIQVMSIRKEVLKSYRQLAEAAGLTLAAVTPRPFALIAGLKHAVATGQVPPPAPPDAPVGLLVRGSKWGEFTIMRGGSLGLTRSMAGPALSTDAALLGEIRRNLALHANQNPDSPVRALYLAEPDTPGGLRERLQDSLAIPVHAYEPLVGVPVPDGPTGGFAGLAGLLALQASREATIDFVHPREPKAPRDPHKQTLLIAAALAAALVLGLFALAYLRVSAKKTQVANLQRDLDDTQDLLHSMDADAKRIKALDEWAATDVNWLDEIYDMTARMKDTKNVRLLSVTANTIDNGGTKANKYAASVSLRGISSADSVPLENFIAEWVKELSYEVEAKELKPNRVLERQLFPREFTTKIKIAKRPPEQYSRTIPGQPPPRRKPKGAGADDGAMFGEGN